MYSHPLMSQFSQWLTKKDSSPNTIKNYLSAVSGFFDWHVSNGGSIENIVITVVDLRDWRTSMESSYKPATVAVRIKAIKEFCEMMVDAKLYDTNPAKNVKLPKIVQTAPKPLTKQQEGKLRRIASAVANNANLSLFEKRTAIRNHAIVMVAINSGLRISEICNLKVQHVVINPRSGSIQVNNGKGDKSRTIPLNADSRTALALWLDARAEWLKELGIQTDACWVGKTGSMSVSGIEYQYNRVASTAGVPTGIHRLRHTCITRLVGNNVPLPVVQKIAGHSSIQTTMSYTEVTDEQMQSAIDKLNL